MRSSILVRQVAGRRCDANAWAMPVGRGRRLPSPLMLGRLAPGPPVPGQAQWAGG